MKILLNRTSLTKSLRPFNDIGFVPTMGSIHKGHLSLINRSNQVCNKTIVSIFVNPKQFNNKKDFKTYPKNMKKDLQLLNKTKQVDFIYVPKIKDIFLYVLWISFKISFVIELFWIYKNTNNCFLTNSIRFTNK